MTAEIVHFRVGDLPCVVLSDGSNPVTEKDITDMFPKDTERMLTAFRALSTPLAFSVNILMVETAGKRVLIDTGTGRDDPADPGHLLDNLRAANIPPESIDTIIITHYHLDHLRGLSDTEGKPTFAKAQLVVPRPEHEYWMNETFLAKMDPNRAQRLRLSFAPYTSRLTLADSSAEIEPGIRYIPAPGHTPGPSAVRIESQGAHLLHMADTVHLPLQLNMMDVMPRFDNQPDAAINTRRAMIEQAVAENLLVMTYHFPSPGVGHIQRTGDALVWVPYSTGE